MHADCTAALLDNLANFLRPFLRGHNVRTDPSSARNELYTNFRENIA